MSELQPINDRRQRAREMFWDANPANSVLDETIKVATQVKITDDIYAEFVERTKTGTFRDGMIAAFRAAGFEVVE